MSKMYIMGLVLYFVKTVRTLKITWEKESYRGWDVDLSQCGNSRI